MISFNQSLKNQYFPLKLVNCRLRQWSSLSLIVLALSPNLSLLTNQIPTIDKIDFFQQKQNRLRWSVSSWKKMIVGCLRQPHRLYLRPSTIIFVLDEDEIVFVWDKDISTKMISFLSKKINFVSGWDLIDKKR